MRIPLILIAGFSQSARHRVIREALAARAIKAVDPSSAPIAWLDHQDSLSSADPSQIKPTQSFVACVCCAGSIVFTTHLTRILRQGAWAGLVVSLGARAEPQRMLELLSRTPWSEHLGAARLFSVMDDSALALCDLPEHPMHGIACQQRDLAEQVLGAGQSLPPDLFANRGPMVG
jgi:hypothetical protein